jgi:hypothetical protein
MPCSPLKDNERFRGKYRLHLQCRRISRKRNQHEIGKQIISPAIFPTCLMLVSWLVLRPEKGSDIILRSILSLCSTRQNSSRWIVKVITKVIYINVNHDMFRPLLVHHQVYLCLLRCWIFVRCGSIFFLIFDHMFMWLLHSSEPLVCLLIGFKMYYYKIKLNWG